MLELEEWSYRGTQILVGQGVWWIESPHLDAVSTGINHDLMVPQETTVSGTQFRRGIVHGGKYFELRGSVASQDACRVI